MAHFVRILKAQRLKKKWKQYLEEKVFGRKEHESDDGFLLESYKKREGLWLVKYSNTAKSPKKSDNLVWKSLVGFIGGVLLTYLFFFFFYIGVNFSIQTTTYICGLAASVLCLGLAFSSTVRCYVLLVLPEFFSKQGREALLAYALFLAFTGPGSNTMHNMGILSDSMTCGQEMVRRTLKQIIDFVKSPFKPMKETLENILKTVQQIARSAKNFAMKIKRLIVSILAVMKHANEWLVNMVNICNKKIGTPFQRCMKCFENAIYDCKAKLGILDFLCHVVHTTKALCYTVKCLDFICCFTEFVSEKIIGEVRKKLKKFNVQLKTLFYVGIEFSETCQLETNTTQEAANTIFKDIANKIEKLQSIFSFFGFTFSLLFLFLLMKVYYYKYKFLSSDQYDNMYINQYIIDLDTKRAQMERETVLPLEPREKKRYSKPTAIGLLKVEKSRIAESMFFLSLTSFKIITFLVIDYSLFWVLLTIYKTGRDAIVEVEKSKLGIHVDGKGLLADFYRNLGNALQVPENPSMRLTPLHCLPDPVQPDTRRYIQIGFLVVLCWILTLTEAYGLRLRNVVMSHYYPHRARQRAVWLYNHILQSRSSFVRYERRQLRRKFGRQLQPTNQISMLQRLFVNFPVLCFMFGGTTENKCLVCDISEGEPKRCKTPDCVGRYCPKCFDTLEKVCTICKHPIDYGDVSDISEEIDSSEDDSNYKKTEESVNENTTYKKFQTFKEMEVRETFRDVEQNKFTDYVKLRDLDRDTVIVRKKLKAVLQKKIHDAKKEIILKNKMKKKMYRKIGLIVQDMITSLKRKKSVELMRRKNELKEKFAEKLENLKTLKRQKKIEQENLSEEKQTRSKTRVSFNLQPQYQETKQSEHKNKQFDFKNTQLEYKKLKEKVKENIKKLKKRKFLEKLSVEHGSHWNRKKKSTDISESSDSDRSRKKKYLTYYFVENEKAIAPYTPGLTRFDRNTSSDESLFKETQLGDEKIDENYIL